MKFFNSAPQLLSEHGVQFAIFVHYLIQPAGNQTILSTEREKFPTNRKPSEPDMLPIPNMANFPSFNGKFLSEK